jgi:hypothetical protein
LDIYPDSNNPHFHIRWSQKTNLDWECYPTYLEASIRGAELVGPEETFVIEEVYLDCPMRRAKAASGH